MFNILGGGGGGGYKRSTFRATLGTMHPGFIMAVHLHLLHPLATGLILEPVVIDLITLVYLT